jgi:hypothetical protein
VNIRPLSARKRRSASSLVLADPVGTAAAYSAQEDALCLTTSPSVMTRDLIAMDTTTCLRLDCDPSTGRWRRQSSTAFPFPTVRPDPIPGRRAPACPPQPVPGPPRPDPHLITRLTTTSRRCPLRRRTAGLSASAGSISHRGSPVQQFEPGAVTLPAVEKSVDGLPRPVLLRQVSPWSNGPHSPPDPVKRL